MKFSGTRSSASNAARQFRHTLSSGSNAGTSPQRQESPPDKPGSGSGTSSQSKWKGAPQVLQSVVHRFKSLTTPDEDDVKLNLHRLVDAFGSVLPRSDTASTLEDVRPTSKDARKDESLASQKAQRIATKGNVSKMFKQLGREPVSGLRETDDPGYISTWVPVVEIITNQMAMVALRENGKLVVWGKANYGGDLSSQEARQLGNGTVKQVCATRSAFTALMADQTVVTWGRCGGDEKNLSANQRPPSRPESSTRQKRVTQVSVEPTTPLEATQILGVVATQGAFAAWSSKGVIVWGERESGGVLDDRTRKKLSRTGVQYVVASKFAFAALTQEQSVAAWGSESNGGDVAMVEAALERDCQAIYSSDCSFAALKSNSSLVTWGVFKPAPEELNKRLDSSESGKWATKVISGGPFFAANMMDGTVVTWGNCMCKDRKEASLDMDEDEWAIMEQGCKWCRDSLEIDKALHGGVVSVSCTNRACTMLSDQGVIVTWGNPRFGGVVPDAVREQLRFFGKKNCIKQVCASDAAFAVLKTHGDVLAWGHPEWGGVTVQGEGQNKDIKELVSNSFAFAAIKKDGSVLTWGVARNGGSIHEVAEQLQSGVTRVYKNRSSFAALKQDGAVVTWGCYSAGGSSAKVAKELDPSFARQAVVPSQPSQEEPVKSSAAQLLGRLRQHTKSLTKFGALFQANQNSKAASENEELIGTSEELLNELNDYGDAIKSSVAFEETDESTEHDEEKKLFFAHQRATLEDLARVLQSMREAEAKAVPIAPKRGTIRKPEIVKETPQPKASPSVKPTRPRYVPPIAKKAQFRKEPSLNELQRSEVRSEERRLAHEAAMAAKAAAAAARQASARAMRESQKARQAEADSWTELNAKQLSRQLNASAVSLHSGISDGHVRVWTHEGLAWAESIADDGSETQSGFMPSRPPFRLPVVLDYRQCATQMDFSPQIPANCTTSSSSFDQWHHGRRLGTWQGRGGGTALLPELYPRAEAGAIEDDDVAGPREKRRLLPPDAAALQARARLKGMQQRPMLTQ